MRGKHGFIVAIILISSYGLYTGFSDIIDSRKEAEKWKAGDFEALVEKCLGDSKKMAVKYPDLSREYCECSMEKIQNKFNREDYIKISKKSIEEQSQYLMPVFQECLDNYKRLIKEKEDIE